MIPVISAVEIWKLKLCVSDIQIVFCDVISNVWFCVR